MQSKEKAGHDSYLGQRFHLSCRPFISSRYRQALVWHISDFTFCAREQERRAEHAEPIVTNYGRCLAKREVDVGTFPWYHVLYHALQDFFHFPGRVQMRKEGHVSCSGVTNHRCHEYFGGTKCTWFKMLPESMAISM